MQEARLRPPLKYQTWLAYTNMKLDPSGPYQQQRQEQEQQQQPQQQQQHQQNTINRIKMWP